MSCSSQPRQLLSPFHQPAVRVLLLWILFQRETIAHCIAAVATHAKTDVAASGMHAPVPVAENICCHSPMRELSIELPSAKVKGTTRGAAAELEAVQRTCQAMLLHSSSISGCNLRRSALPLPAFDHLVKFPWALSSCKSQLNLTHKLLAGSVGCPLLLLVYVTVASEPAAHRRLYIIFDQVERILAVGHQPKASSRTMRRWPSSTPHNLMFA